MKHRIDLIYFFMVLTDYENFNSGFEHYSLIICSAV